ncbi:MAG: PF20097 family protein [Candidatus Thorarchaeota archaeon]
METAREHHSCPSCGKEMEKGYLFGHRGVYWGDHVPRLIVSKASVLNPHTTETFKMSYVPSFRCRSCKLIQYGEPADFAWLTCPHCGARYEYEIANNSLRIICQNCNKPFNT